MKHLYKLALLSMMAWSTGTSYGALYEYDWTGGTPGYTGTIILDANSSTGGSISDIISLVVTTPINGTINVDLNPADNNVYLGTRLLPGTPARLPRWASLGTMSREPAT